MSRMNAFAALLLVAATSVAAAQKSQSTGFFLGAGLEGNGITTNESGSTTESGSGLGITLGYGFTPTWSLYGQLSGASINADGGGTYTLAHFDIGARVHFRSGPNTVVPFLQFGLAGRGVSQDVNGSSVTGNGAGISLGGGLNAHFSPKVAFSGAVTWTVGSFDHFAVDGNSVNGTSVDATSARVHLGLVWFP